MFKNYITIALRNLWRNKLYTVINIFGIGIGLATMVWAFQNYNFAFSFDQIHHDQDQIFRVDIFREGNEIPRGICPMALAMSAKEDFSSVEEAVRYDRQNIAVKSDLAQPFYENVHFVDPSFFELFDYQMVTGSNNISDKNSIVITEEMAKKYFGVDESNYKDALNKTLTIYSSEAHQQILNVVGVIEDSPENSSIWFKMLTHFENQFDFQGEPIKPDNWRWFADAVFLKLKNPSDAPRLADDLKKYIGPQNAAREDWKVTGFMLEPMAQWANHENDLWNNGLQSRPDNSAVYGPVVLAFLIFLVCCLNFANTTVARSNRRLKEMGVRKVMGGTQRQLVSQMLMECGLIVLMGVFVAVQLNQYWLPAYNQMWQGLDLKADYLHDHQLLVFMGTLILFTTIVAGSYPAFYISRFNPTNIFRGGVKFGGSNLFSRLLLGLQVVISLMTVIASVAFSKNAEFQKSYDYGYTTDNLVFAQIRDNESFKGYMDAVKQLPDVEKIAGTDHHVGYSWWLRTFEAKGERKEAGYMAIGEDYLETVGLEIIAGRGFDPKMASDQEEAMLINEKMASLFGWDKDNVIGQKISIDSLSWTVVGLLKDFHVNDLFSEISPIAMSLSKPENYGRLVAQVAPGKLNSVMDQMKGQWEKMFPYTPFEGFYQNELIAEAQKVTNNVAWIFSLFAIVSVLLTAVGLFALVSQTVMKKMKEIAVRKVVGATPKHILILVNKGYVWIFLVAAVVGCYGGWFLTKLLMDMIFRINVGINFDTLLISSAAVFFIAFLTVGIKVWHAVRTNPAEVLKGE